MRFYKPYCHAALQITFTAALVLIKLQPCLGQTNLDEALRAIYEFRLQDANRLIQEGEKLNPQAAEWPLASAYLAWVQMLSGRTDDESVKREFETGLDRCERLLVLDQNDKEGQYRSILVSAFRTRHHLLDESYFSALAELDRCIDKVKSSFGHEEQYEPLKLTSGLYLYYMWRAKEDYFWLRPALLVYPDGHRERGLDYLHEMARSNDLFLRSEAHYFLLRTYLDLEENAQKALFHAQALTLAFSNNLLFRYYELLCFERLENEAAAALSLKKYEQSCSANTQLSAEQRDFYTKMLVDRQQP